MVSNNFKEFLINTIKALNESKIRYVVVGGVAASIFGRPRTTMDIDVIIENDKDGITKIQRVLKKNGFEFGENEIQIAIEEKSHCSIYFRDYPYRIDLQGVYSALDRRSMENQIVEIVFEEKMSVEKPEDLIIAKLVYGSSQDLEDAQAIILRQGEKLDLEYIRIFAEKEQVLQDFEQILQDSLEKDSK